jgi:hypothetical protein
MFNIFKKKSKVEKLNDQYKKLLEESYELSTTNRWDPLESTCRHAS